ncbi:TPR/glycosyl transferase domain protein [Marinobacter adhaerens HP15]|uniref:TPR/glycosyl transferase domain protein n=1 Tax=Marinobacter adhaerens (strain DSM 23420 / HP15) TaxID=225937 RepID=E4PPZ4_MARAH|nr:TPR/glycosyl transferase domain protein [Marinobacter adhaerens HP15]
MSSTRADLKDRHILFIAYFYPPTDSTGVPGCMRTIKFVRNLANGRCHVLTTSPQTKSSPDALAHLHLPVNREQIHRVKSLDIFKFLLWARKRIRLLTSFSKRAEPTDKTVQSVLKTSNTNGEVASRSKVQKFKDFIYDACYFPDQAGPWIIPAVIKGIKVVKQHNIDAIFATGSPWSGLVAGYLISRLSSLPLIVDFRDPWMNNPFHQSKGRLLDDWSARLERRVVKHASAVSLNTDPLHAEFVHRYPDEPANKFFVMPNGFDSAEFQNIVAEPRVTVQDSLLLCHAGFLYGVRDPAVLLEAIRAANQQLADSGKRIVFRQIGDVNLGYDLKDRFSDLLEDGSLILDSARPYKECLSALASADIVVNVQPGTRTQIPSKLYDYLAINKPIINITSPDGALGTLVIDKKLGDLVSFEEKEQLTQLLKAYALDEKLGSFSGYENRDEFEISHITQTLARRLHECLDAP